MSPEAREPSSYFMVRVRHPPGGAPGAISGHLERLGTGEKMPFGSAEELVRLIAAWLPLAATPEA